METNFDGCITEDILKGSFLALKQLQSKGKKIAKLKQTPTIAEKEVPRSPLYQRFKEIHGFGKITPEPLNTRVPKSLLMYKTYTEIYKEKHKKIRFNEENKPDHPFFGKNAVLAEDFTMVTVDGDSQVFQETIGEMELEGLIKKYNYNMMPEGEFGYSVKSKTPVIRPSKVANREVKMPENFMTPELLESVQRILIESDDES